MEAVLMVVGVVFCLWGASLRRKADQAQMWSDFERRLYNFEWSTELQEEADEYASWASVCTSIGGASLFAGLALLVLA